MSAATLLSSIAKELRAHEPFSEIPAAQVEAFAAKLKVRYFSQGEVIISLADGKPSEVYLIKSGRVVGERLGIAGIAVPALELDYGEMFPIGAVLTDRAVQSTFRAASDTLVYCISAQNFKAALNHMPALQDFCERRLFNLLERSRALLRSAYSAESLTEHPFSQPISSAIVRAPVTCLETASIKEALIILRDEKVGAIVLVNTENCAVGILTERDVIKRIVLPQVSLTQPVSRVATRPAIALDAAQSMSVAALLMIEHHIRHIVVTRNGKLAGVISERGLFALQRKSLSGIADAIASAPHIAALVQSATDIRDLSRALAAQGVAAGLLTQFISHLNDELTQRLIFLIAAQHAITCNAQVRWCWIALGSEGRREQTISTDQDNGIIFQCDFFNT